MMKSPRVFLVLTLAAILVACGGSEKNETPASGGRAAVSKATDDIPTSNHTGLYLDHFRFGTATDADGIVVTETSVIPAGSTAVMSFYVRNVPAGTQVRIVWNDLNRNSAVEEVKPVGDKGLATFKQASPSPEGSYRVNMYVKKPGSKGWDNLGTHDFRVGGKS
jgi:hypothetical protein